MAKRIVVVGAALIQSDGQTPYLFVARHINKNGFQAYWEFPGGPVFRMNDDDKERDVINDVFRNEFGTEVRSDIRVGFERDVQSWVDRRGNSQDATLRVWRTQPSLSGIFNMRASEPQPRMYHYDESSWVPLANLDAVSSWRPEDRITAEEVRDHFYNDDVWQKASLPSAY